MNQFLEFLKRVSAVAGTVSKLAPRLAGLLTDARDEFTNLKRTFKPAKDETKKELFLDDSASHSGSGDVHPQSLFPTENE